jgi:hypothetical protein
MINPLMTEEGKKFKSEIRNRRDISVKEKQELIKQFVDNYGKEPVSEPVVEPVSEPVVEPVSEPVVEPVVSINIDDDIPY